MAAPTTPIDDLLALFSADEQAVIRAVVLKNDKAKQQLEVGLTMRKEYFSEEVTPPAAAIVPPVAAPITTPVAPPVITSSATPSADLAAILAKLDGLNTSLTAQVDDLKKNSIQRSELPTMRGEVLELTLRNADQMTQIRLQHEREFPNEPFDLDKVNEFINERSKSGQKFSDIKSAYDDMVRDKRIEAKIAKGIVDGVKQKRSGENVPGQTNVTAISPAQELIRKQKGEAGATEHVQSFADKLRRIRESRESREGVGEEAAS